MSEYFKRTYDGNPKALAKAVADIYPELPYSLLMRLVDKRDVFLNGARAPKGAQVRSGDAVDLFCAPDLIRIRVVYRDQDLLVLYKPKGVASAGERSFESLARYVFGDVRLLHRLDTNTDGLLMFALNERAYEILYRLNAEHRITKYYLARVLGEVREETVLEGWLVKDESAGRVRILHQESADADRVKCVVTPLAYKDGLTTVTIALRGGKTHQLRAQLADWGHFILGDGKYGDDRVNRRYGKDKQQLTAYKLVFPSVRELPHLSEATIELPADLRTVQ